MSYVVHTEKLEDLTIKIVQDESAENPFTNWDCEPDIIGWHRRYNFNTRKEDKQKIPDEFLREAAEKGYVYKPLYMYDHSGISFKTQAFECAWDSGQYGFIFWTPEKRKLIGTIDEYIKGILQEGETVETWLGKQLDTAVDLLNDYVTGNVWGFIIEDSEGETIESCYSFFGDYESENGCLAEAKDVAAHCVNERAIAAKKNQEDLAKTLGIAS